MASKTVNGLFWSSMERLSVQGAQFVLSLFIARILSPSDYGLGRHAWYFHGGSSNVR